jgi:hypothetical protein
LWSCA